MLKWQEGGGGFNTSKIPSHMRQRAAELFRCGMLIGAAPSGGGQLSSPLPEGDLREDNGAMVVDATHAEGAPRVPVGCPLVAIGSDTDVVWPDSLVRRWADVAAPSLDPAGADDGGGNALGERFIWRTIAGQEHIKLMCHEETMETCFMEIAVAAARRYRS